MKREQEKMKPALVEKSAEAPWLKKLQSKWLDPTFFKKDNNPHTTCSTSGKIDPILLPFGTSVCERVLFQALYKNSKN